MTVTRARRDSTCLWLRSVPAHWREAKLSLGARLGSGHTPSRSHPDWWTDCTIPWITTGEVAQMRSDRIEYISQTREMISEVGIANSSAVVHPAGTVVLSRTASAGYSAIMAADMATSQDFVTWTCGPELNPRFLLLCLRAMRADLLERLAMGSTHKTIYMPDVDSIRVPLPPTAEQADIVERAWDELRRIDALIDAKQQMIGVVREGVAAAIDDAFGCRAPHIRWDGVPDALGGGWPMVRLGQVATVQSGLTIDSGRSYDNETAEVPYLRVANVQDGMLDLGEIKTAVVDARAQAQHELRRGDVLMTEGGDPDKLGRGAVWRGEIEPCLHQNHVFAVRPDSSALDAEFLALLTRSTYARAYFEMTATKTTGIASTSTTKIASFRVPLPRLDDQRALVGETNERLATLGDLTDTLTRQIELLPERRQSLITAAVTGEMEIP